MISSRLHLESTVHAEQARQQQREALEHIRRMLDAKQLHLAELISAISAVPGLSERLYRILTNSGIEYGALSDATVLAGRSGIRMVICECLQEANEQVPAVLFLVPGASSSQPFPSSAQSDGRLAKL